MEDDFKLTSVLSFFVLQYLTASTVSHQKSVSFQLSVGANFFGVNGHHEKQKKIQFFFYKRCFFFHINSPQNSIGNDNQFLSFRSVKKNYRAKNRKKYSFLEKISLLSSLRRKNDILLV